MQYVNDEDAPERQITPEEYLAEQKSAIRKRAFWGIGIGGFLVIVPLGWLILFGAFGLKPDYSILFKNILFILGLIIFSGGIWGLYYAKNLKPEDLIPTQEAIDFARQSEISVPYYTYIFVGSIIAVMLAQMSFGINESVAAAGLVKQGFWERGEYWRILTSGVMHSGLLHIFFNGQALNGFGGLVEYLSNRAHLAVVFVLAIIGGSLCSLFFMPDSIPTVGASGGIMGLIGYLAIYGFRRKRQLPPDFLKNMLVNVGFIAVFGLIAYQIIDNFAHLGGFFVGAIYGFLQIPKDLKKNPREVGAIAELAGYAAMIVFVFTCIFSILLLMKIVE